MPTAIFSMFDIDGIEAIPINLHIDGDKLIWWNGKENKKIPADKWSAETEDFFSREKQEALFIEAIMPGDAEEVDLELWR